MCGRAATHDVTQHSVTFGDVLLSGYSLAAAWLLWKLRVTPESRSAAAIPHQTWPTVWKPAGAGANDLPMNCVGTITAGVNIGPTRVSQMSILVVKDLSAPAFLGTDILRQFSCYFFR